MVVAILYRKAASELNRERKRERRWPFWITSASQRGVSRNIFISILLYKDLFEINIFPGRKTYSEATFL